MSNMPPISIMQRSADNAELSREETEELLRYDDAPPQVMWREFSNIVLPALGPLTPATLRELRRCYLAGMFSMYKLLTAIHPDRADQVILACMTQFADDLKDIIQPAFVEAVIAGVEHSRREQPADLGTSSTSPTPQDDSEEGRSQ